MTDALFELRNFMRKDSSAIMAESKLYAEFDKYFYDRDPAADALVIAAAMQNDPDFPEKAMEIAERLDWPPRRLNPALAYLVERKLVRETLYIGGGPFVATEIARTDATRRFVKSRL